jgi:hypothetical protein
MSIQAGCYFIRTSISITVIVVIAAIISTTAGATIDRSRLRSRLPGARSQSCGQFFATNPTRRSNLLSG